MVDFSIRYWFTRELRFYCSCNTFGLFIEKPNDAGIWYTSRELFHFRVENLKGKGG